MLDREKLIWKELKEAGLPQCSEKRFYNMFKITWTDCLNALKESPNKEEYLAQLLEKSINLGRIVPERLTWII